MRKISFTSFFFIASLVISMFVNSNSYAGSSARNTGSSNAATEAARQQQLDRIQRMANDPSATGTTAQPTVHYDAFGNVISGPESQQPGYGQMPSAQSQDGLAFPDTRGDENGVPVSGSVAPSAAEPPPVVDTGVSGDSIRTSRSVPSGATSVSSEEACTEAASTARSACLMPGTGGMDEGTAAMFSMMMTVQLPAMVTQMASIGKNMSQQCQVQADISKVMATINGVKGAACATTISTCKAKCGEEATYESEQASLHASSVATEELVPIDKKKMVKAKTAAATCSGYTGQVMGMMMSAMQSGVSAVANSQCASDLAAFNSAVPTFTPPKLATIGGCEDPNNQTLACYCARPGNAKSAMCSGFTGGGSLAGGGTTTTPNGSTVASPYASTAATDGTDGNTVDPFAPPKGGAGGDHKGQGDGGSGAPGSGGLASLASEGGGGGPGGDPRSAITGTSGGTGGGLGGAGGGGGGGGGLARNNGGAGKDGGFLDKFNLKRFLPGSKYKTRGIAGMSVKSVDGITGPMGPSLFEKATRQYQEQIQKQTVILEK